MKNAMMWVDGRFFHGEHKPHVIYQITGPRNKRYVGVVQLGHRDEDGALKYRLGGHFTRARYQMDRKAPIVELMRAVPEDQWAKKFTIVPIAYANNKNGAYALEKHLIKTTKPELNVHHKPKEY